MSVPKPYTNDDQHSFAFTSVNRRWPAILAGAISDLEAAAANESGPKKSEADELVAKFRELKSHVENDLPIQRVREAPDAADYNGTLLEAAKELGKEITWHNAPWMLSECFMYRHMQASVLATQHWKSYDFFEHTKNDTFGKSADAVAALAKRYEALSKEGATSKDAREVVFHELAQAALWGNATDLSLLVTVSLEELKRLQVAADQRDKDKVLVNDFAKMWKTLSRVEGGRVDIVLDNSGFELYTDLIFGLFLLETNLADQIVLHPKSQPWFVSDVTPKDWGVSLVQLLRDEKLFAKERGAIDFVIEKLLVYQQEGKIVARQSPFWTTPLPFWEIRRGGKGGGEDVWRDLRTSKLVVLKGDLNYRKLTGDVAWPRTTPFPDAIRELASSGITLVSLRTIKADVVVGLPEGKEQELEAHWKKEHPDQLPESWAWSGQYAVVTFFS